MEITAMYDIYGKSFLIFLLYSQPFQAFTEYLDMLFSTFLHRCHYILDIQHTFPSSFTQIYHYKHIWLNQCSSLEDVSASSQCLISAVNSQCVCVCVRAHRHCRGILYSYLHTIFLYSTGYDSWASAVFMCFSGCSGGNTRFVEAAQHSEDTETSSCRKQQLMSSVERGYWFNENMDGVNWTLFWPVPFSHHLLILEMAAWGKRVMNIKTREVKYMSKGRIKID